MLVRFKVFLKELITLFLMGLPIALIAAIFPVLKNHLIPISLLTGSYIYPKLRQQVEKIRV